ncbi:MAG: element excision factor XisH family protein [Pyrinomonadaceae bacterium]
MWALSGCWPQKKEGSKVAVEIKSFVGPSEIEDLKNAVGQFVLYRAVMHKTEPDRELYLAVRQATFLELFDEPLGKLLIESEQIKLIVFDPLTEVIVRWVN